MFFKDLVTNSGNLSINEGNTSECCAELLRNYFLMRICVQRQKVLEFKKYIT